MNYTGSADLMQRELKIAIREILLRKEGSPGKMEEGETGKRIDWERGRMG